MRSTEGISASTLVIWSTIVINYGGTAKPYETIMPLYCEISTLNADTMHVARQIRDDIHEPMIVNLTYSHLLTPRAYHCIYTLS